MQLIQRISGVISKYAMSGLSEQTLSAIIIRNGLIEEGIEALSIENGRFFFSVPEQDWSEDTIQPPHQESATKERRIYDALEKIGEEYDMQVQASNMGFSMNWLNDARKRLNAQFTLERTGCKLEEDFDEEALRKNARTIEIARIHPRYIVFNDRQANLTKLNSYQDKDAFLGKIVRAAYRQD